VVVSTAFAGAAAAAGGEEVFILDGAVKMSPEGKLFSHIQLHQYLSNNPAWNGSEVTLTGARAERLDFQVMVRAGDDGLADVNVSVSDLAGSAGSISAADGVKLFREWYTEVTIPSTSPMANAGLGFYPDALVPSTVRNFGLPVNVEAGKIQGIWVDVIVPRDAAPGEYSGTITATAGGGDDARVLAELPIKLVVRDFEIPAEPHLRWRVGYSGWDVTAINSEAEPMTKGWLEVEREVYRITWEDCRMAPTTHYNTPNVPYTWEDGVFTWDFTEFDKRFGPYLDGSAFADGVPVNIFSMPIYLRNGIPTGGRSLEAMANLDTDMLAAATRALIKHWDEKGWNLESTFVYVADEPNPPFYPHIKRACDAINEASDGKIYTSMAFYTHFRADPAAHVNEFKDHITMWDIAGDCMSQVAFDMLKEQQAKGDSIGFYQGSEPFCGSEALDGDGLSMTTWPWIAWRHGLDTLFYYNMTEWQYFRLNRSDRPWARRIRNIWTNPLNQSWQTNSQGVFIYPGYVIGYRGVIPSIRLKQIRRGMQDYEYLWLLGQAGRRDLADKLCKRIIPQCLHECGGGDYRPAVWQRDPREWSRARREMAEAIVSASGQ
jgi:hypothetical protein